MLERRKHPRFQTNLNIKIKGEADASNNKAMLHKEQGHLNLPAFKGKPKRRWDDA
jgi:hypothetical protein